MVAESQGNTQLAQRLSTTFSLAQNEAIGPCWSENWQHHALKLQREAWPISTHAHWNSSQDSTRRRFCTLVLFICYVMLFQSLCQLKVENSGSYDILVHILCGWIKCIKCCIDRTDYPMNKLKKRVAWSCFKGTMEWQNLPHAEVPAGHASFENALNDFLETMHYG